MANYVIGVGGTGSRCMDALVRMLALGMGQKSGAELKLLLVDADVNNPRKEEIDQLVTAYKALREMLQEEAREESAPFQRGLDVFRSVDGQNAFMWVPHSRILANGPEKNLRGLLNASGGIEKEIASIFVEDARLDMQINGGFNAQPSIGAAVISLLSDDEWNQNDQDLMSAFLLQLLQDCNANQNVNVIITGSVFGGTGAAGIPQIARSIRKVIKGGAAANLKLYAVVPCPYFIPPEPALGNGQFNVSQYEYQQLVANGLYADLGGNAMRAADVMNTLGEESLYDAICVLGEPEPMQLHTWAGGGAGQDNPPHYVEVIAANTILDILDGYANVWRSDGGMAFVFGRPDQKEDFEFEELSRGKEYADAFKRQLAHAIFLKFEVADIWEGVGRMDDCKKVDGYLRLMSNVYKWWYVTLADSDKEIQLLPHDRRLDDLLRDFEMENPGQFVYDNQEGERYSAGYQLFLDELIDMKSREILSAMRLDIATSSFAAIFADSYQATGQ